VDFLEKIGHVALGDLLASPSAKAVFPTPGSPTKNGVFFRRRQSTCMVRSISV